MFARRHLHLSLLTLTTLALGCGDPTASDTEPADIEQGSDGLAADQTIPGLVMGLRHNFNQAPNRTIMPSAPDFVAQPMEGGDLGAPRHRGYEWLVVRDEPRLDPASVRLPPGVVLALRHSQNNRVGSTAAFGRDAVIGPASFPGFVKQVGGDHGAPAGQGYFWYESNGVGFTDWASVRNLPRMAVVGLKHTANQRNKTFVWNGQVFDAGNPNGPAPAGFARVCGGDLGAANGVGYCWFERTEGESSRGASIPTFQFSLPRSLFVGDGERFIDHDGDGLVDGAEALLAEITKPFLRFARGEVHRKAEEPVTLFRVFRNPARDWSSFKAVTIRWVFLFRSDGGYASGLCSLFGGNAHGGDNDTATWDLQSVDGVTWFFTRLRLGMNINNQMITWPGNSGRVEVRGLTHPVIYMSLGKHHEYFNRDHDGNDSFYSGAPDPCNDDVDGLGTSVLPQLDTLGPFHNVGEKDAQLIDGLGPIFPGERAWGTNKFLGGGSDNLSAFTKILP